MNVKHYLVVKNKLVVLVTFENRIYVYLVRVGYTQYCQYMWTLDKPMIIYNGGWMTMLLIIFKKLQ